MNRKQERQRRLERRFVLEYKHAVLEDFERSTLSEILKAEAAKPMRGGNRDLAASSLFGDGHKQEEMGL